MLFHKALSSALEQAGAVAVEYVAYPTPSTQGGTLGVSLDDPYESLPS